MGVFTKIILGAAGAGLVVGGLLGVLTAPDSAAGTLARDAVPVYLCPSDSEVGTLYRGDRVLVIGRSGDWLAVRNVRGAGERVFVLAASIVPDADLSGLPEVDCDDVGTVTFDTTTTTSTSTTTTTSTSTTTTVAPTTTTAPPPPPPSVGQVSRSQSEIEEWYPENMVTCGVREATSVISAPVTAPAGVQSVVMNWSSSMVSGGPVTMTGQGGTYSAVLGPFDAEATPLPPGQSIDITVTVTATDSLGRQANGQTTVTLHGCP